MLTTTADIEALRTRLAAVADAVQAAATAAYARAAAPAGDKAAALRARMLCARDARLRPDRETALERFTPPPLSPAPAKAAAAVDLKQAAILGALQALGRG